MPSLRPRPFARSAAREAHAVTCPANTAHGAAGRRPSEPGRRLEHFSVGSLSPEQLYRIIEPLVDAGLEQEQIRTLLFDLAFDAIVSEGTTMVSDVTAVVRDQPPEVQVAWMRVIDRMIAGGAASPPVS